MDVIAYAGFGLKVDSQKDKNDQFVRTAKRAFKSSLLRPLGLLLRKYLTTLYNGLFSTKFVIYNLAKFQSTAAAPSRQANQYTFIMYFHMHKIQQ